MVGVTRSKVVSLKSCQNMQGQCDARTHVRKVAAGVGAHAKAHVSTYARFQNKSRDRCEDVRTYARTSVRTHARTHVRAKIRTICQIWCRNMSVRIYVRAHVREETQPHTSVHMPAQILGGLPGHLRMSIHLYILPSSNHHMTTCQITQLTPIDTFELATHNNIAARTTTHNITASPTPWTCWLFYP